MKASFFRSRGVEEFDDAGDPRPLFDPAVVESGRYLESGASLYAEHGVGRDVTLIASALLKVADLEARDRDVAGDTQGLSYGIPDLHLGARLPLARGRWAAAVEPSVSIPLRAVDRRTSDSPRIGSESASFSLGASVGSAVPVANGYAQVGAGYRARAGRASDEWFADAEAGVAPWGPLRLRLRYDRVDARRVRSGMGDALTPEAGAQDARRIAPTAALGWRGGSELSLTYRRTFAGRSALRGSEWELAYAFLGAVRR
ncbi:MAG TPA: hypothetical protein VFU59_05540 [Candidatus Eisenbacteria bacterium]|nr:hypothetical protein [Candidatus Eisenbacteria bacterium]